MENKLEGTSGESGCHGHSDWEGHGYDIECKSNYPEWLKEIIQFRNKSIRKEWGGSLEHDVYGKTQEECMEKSRELGRRVRERLDEIKERYGKFDEAINKLIKNLD
jgi:hypothetical protein